MEEIKNLNNNRRIIFVDASFNNETNEAKVSLYDKEISKLDTLSVANIINSSDAEKYAILYACLYTKKKNIIDRKIHILNDNYNATKDENILNICKYFGVGVSWIPREINEIADKGCRLDTNIREEDSRILELLYDILTNSSMSNIDNSLENDLIITDSKGKNILKNAIRHTKIENKPYVSIGQVGKYLQEHNPTFKYSQLKKELLKYKDDFIIVNENYVKIK